MSSIQDGHCYTNSSIQDGHCCKKKYRTLQCFFLYIQAILMSMCLQSMVDELISQKQGRKIKRVSQKCIFVKMAQAIFYLNFFVKFVTDTECFERSALRKMYSYSPCNIYHVFSNPNPIENGNNTPHYKTILHMVWFQCNFIG